jgi:hypothetical protein
MPTFLTQAAVNTIADLRAVNGASHSVIRVLGYNSAGDGGGGEFYYNSSDTTSADNGATIFVSTVAGVSYRFYRDWDQGSFNVLWAGADPSGSASSDIAFAAAANVSTCIYVPKGIYQLDNNFSFTIPAGEHGFTLFGDGAELTILFFPTNAGVTVNYNSASSNLAHMRDLTLSAGQASGGTALQLVYSSSVNIIGGLSDVTNVKIRGNDYGQTLYWGTGIYCDGVSSVSFTNVSVTGCSSNHSGIGLNLVGNSIGSIVFNIVDCIFDFLSTGVIYGNYIQGVTVFNSQFTGTVTGIYNGTGETNLDQLTVIGCQFSASGNSILLESQTGNCIFGQNQFGFNGTVNAGVMVKVAVSNISCTGNIFIGNSSTNTVGLEIMMGPTGIIAGNVFALVSTGVLLGSATNHMNVQSNLYNAVTTQVSNSGTSNTVGGGST